MWSEEDYCNARKSQWQQDYLDRIRFRDKINEINAKIGYIFIRRHEDYKVACLFRNMAVSTSEAIAL